MSLCRLPMFASAQDCQPFGVGGHDAVFDAVVHHLDEVAGARGPAVQVALLGGAVELLAAWGARYVAHARRERLENRVEALDRLIRAADHHAVAAFQSPDAAAGAHVHVVNPLRRKFPGAADVIHVVGIASIDKDVPFVRDGAAGRRWSCPRPPPGPSTRLLAASPGSSPARRAKRPPLLSPPPIA